MILYNSFVVLALELFTLKVILEQPVDSGFERPERKVTVKFTTIRITRRKLLGLGVIHLHHHDHGQLRHDA